MNTNATVARTASSAHAVLLIHLALAGCTLAALGLNLVGHAGWPWLAVPYGALALLVQLQVMQRRRAQSPAQTARAEAVAATAAATQALAATWPLPPPA